MVHCGDHMGCQTLINRPGGQVCVHIFRKCGVDQADGAFNPAGFLCLCLSLAGDEVDQRVQRQRLVLDVDQAELFQGSQGVVELVGVPHGRLNGLWQDGRVGFQQAQRDVAAGEEAAQAHQVCGGFRFLLGGFDTEVEGVVDRRFVSVQRGLSLQSFLPIGLKVLQVARQRAVCFPHVMPGLSQRQAAQFLSQRVCSVRVLRSAQLQQKIAGHVRLKGTHLK